MNQLPSHHIFGVKVTTASEEKILEYIIEFLKKERGHLFITTPNPEIIMYAQSHPEFRKILNEADVALPDGVGVGMASHLMGEGSIKRISGVDFMQKLCALLAESADSIGLFGGQRGVAEKTAECLQKKYSGMKISYISEEWNTAKLKGKNLDVLFVAMGFPRQEEFIYKNLPHIPVRVGMGVGGSFDFIAGFVPRAPKILRSLGLEWLYRLFVQPWRWKRQLALISFSLLTFQEAIRARMRP